MIRVLSPKNNQTILEPTTLIEMSEEFTNDAHEQALLQGPKARVFLKSLLKPSAFCDELECVPTNIRVTLSALGVPNG